MEEDDIFISNNKEEPFAIGETVFVSFANKPSGDNPELDKWVFIVSGEPMHRKALQKGCDAVIMNIIPQNNAYLLKLKDKNAPTPIFAPGEFIIKSKENMN